MSNHNGPTNAKRQTLKLTGKLIAVAPLIPLIAWKKSSAAIELKKVTEDNLVANSLSYVNDTSQVDKKKFPKFEANQICANCHFYSGIEDSEWGGCSIIGKLVKNTGWCRAWYVKS
ncbi:MAG: high-potential iron-sulfur protein [Gammaproteobacteria bacterium]|nr:high-potential iron-sulfur protein [Gammaproteobacteria bacterium]